ncbi:MAG: hypothetical protein HXS46_05980 [Theionarchaea archaeon]|nr:MAG: hypothetical protein AYK18_10375 [Theionarchaea archaeon DG-70]MBU7010220.1 hypothetical protein [Theionarchaea archaeon]
MGNQENTDISSETAEHDLYYAFTHVDPQRVHITLTIDDFDCITEDRRYIFYNRGDKTVSILPLPARERKTQRNMKILDFSDRNLVFIPSFSSTNLFVNACATILGRASEHLEEPQREPFENIRRKIQPALEKVFKYKPDNNDIKSVHDLVGDILKEETLKSKKFIGEIFPFVEIVKQYNNGLYYPLIALLEPLQPHNYVLIRLSVERLREFLTNKTERFKTFAWFGAMGRFTFSFIPELHPGISNHIRVYAPEGLSIRDVEFDLSSKGLEESDLCRLEEELNKKKKDYFDERCFYIQLGSEESTTLYNCETHLNLTFGLSRKGFHVGILPLLSFFLWLTVLSPAVLEFLRSAQFILMLLTLSVTILVAIGIYAIDKKIVNHFIITQVILAFLVFAVEIVFIALF